jgi:hypothetical protein
MKVPSNLALLINNDRKDINETIKLILKNPEDHINNMILLSKICSIKIKFKSPVVIMAAKRKPLINLLEYIFNNLFLHEDYGLCYALKDNCRNGYRIPGEIKSYEPVLNSIDPFNIYESVKIN